MSNYLNQIESDLYKLNSITNGSGEVVEMVAELKERYLKAKAFDNLVDVAYWHFERIHPDDDNGLQYESFYDDIRDEFKKLESGESDA